ncbi:MAG: hypothetical protein R3C15_02525 [Thermoleophilia bacterium]
MLRRLSDFCASHFELVERTCLHGHVTGEAAQRVPVGELALLILQIVAPAPMSRRLEEPVLLARLAIRLVAGQRALCSTLGPRRRHRLAHHGHGSQGLRPGDERCKEQAADVAERPACNPERRGERGVETHVIPAFLDPERPGPGRRASLLRTGGREAGEVRSRAGIDPVPDRRCEQPRRQRADAADAGVLECMGDEAQLVEDDTADREVARARARLQLADLPSPRSDRDLDGDEALVLERRTSRAVDQLDVGKDAVGVELELPIAVACEVVADLVSFGLHRPLGPGEAPDRSALPGQTREQLAPRADAPLLVTLREQRERLRPDEQRRRRGAGPLVEQHADRAAALRHRHDPEGTPLPGQIEGARLLVGPGRDAGPRRPGTPARSPGEPVEHVCKAEPAQIEQEHSPDRDERDPATDRQRDERERRPGQGHRLHRAERERDAHDDDQALRCANRADEPSRVDGTEPVAQRLVGTHCRPPAIGSGRGPLAGPPPDGGVRRSLPPARGVPAALARRPKPSCAVRFCTLETV